MKLRTLIPVTYNDGIVSQTSGIVTMELGSVAYTNNFTNIGVNYTYKNANGGVIASNAFFIDGEEAINAFYDQIKPYLPPFENEVQYTQAKFYEGAKIQMAQTYNISLSDIEIVND